MARIKDLSGKYYGTIVILDTPEEDEIKIWCPDYYAKPFASSREIEQNNWTPEDGHDHVEDSQSYFIAQVVSRALTDAGL